jgi:hypothetical protein
LPHGSEKQTGTDGGAPDEPRHDLNPWKAIPWQAPHPFWNGTTKPADICYIIVTSGVGQGRHPNGVTTVNISLVLVF